MKPVDQDVFAEWGPGGATMCRCGHEITSHARRTTSFPSSSRSHCLACTCVYFRAFVAKAGNCMSAVLASILEVPLAEVPTFVAGDEEWWQRMRRWCLTRGFDCEPTDRSVLGPGYALAGGPGPRGFRHSVVWHGGPDGAVVHDPHPSRDGLLEVDHFLEFPTSEPARLRGVTS